MSFFKYLAASIVLITTVLNSSAAPTPLPCVTLKSGLYKINTVAVTPGLPLTVGESIATGNILITEANPPVPGQSIWRLTAAGQGGYNIENAGLGRNITTFYFTAESGLILPVVSSATVPADTFAIQCAGGGEYVIKSVNADQLFTTTPSNIAGISNIELRPSVGSRATQHWNFVAA
ncbi:hypothetical protein BDN70DRAFT_996495 [Pholiota conissans]|uniref:Ricin B lectin domain-containing protein n=1 Tax=Pholiota conissans TaxID=109636 RepID=A0A9P5YT48_9AGAR|nr:hypothetical protein BDN70DRAFT_996495 [Pholiota conissans]